MLSGLVTLRGAAGAAGAAALSLQVVDHTGYFMPSLTTYCQVWTFFGYDLTPVDVLADTPNLDLVFTSFARAFFQKRPKICCFCLTQKTLHDRKYRTVRCPLALPDNNALTVVCPITKTPTRGIALAD